MDTVNSIKPNITVYPNPFTSFLTIKNATNSKIIITDIYGKTIQQQTVNNNQFNIDLSACNSGIYLLRIEFDNNIYYKKIIKK